MKNYLVGILSHVTNTGVMKEKLMIHRTNGSSISELLNCEDNNTLRVRFKDNHATMYMKKKSNTLSEGEKYYLDNFPQYKYRRVYGGIQNG